MNVLSTYLKSCTLMFVLSANSNSIVGYLPVTSDAWLTKWAE